MAVASPGKDSTQLEDSVTPDTIRRSPEIKDNGTGERLPVEGDDNRFQKAISAWRNVNLSQLVLALDTTASDLAAYQRDALVERKDLAQKTKDFKKLDDTAKLPEMKVLLKAYQTYIDLISNQSKAVSTSFFQVYSSLSEAPDPYPLLEASVESLVLADETLPKLKDENKHFRSSTAKLESQLEEAEGKLQEERSMRVALEESQETKIKEVEASWSAVLTEKQDNWDSLKKSLEDRAENQERLFQELKASYEVSQRLGEGEQIDQGTVPKSSSAFELEIVTSDLERANARLAEVQSRNEQLRIELAHIASQQDTSSPSGTVEEEPSFLRLRTENSSLIRRAEALRYENESEKREFETMIRNLRNEIAALKASDKSLKAKVDRWSDYGEIKKELEILKSIEFSGGEFEDEDGQPGETSERPFSDINASTQRDESQSLEQLLLARNKKLNSELTLLRVSRQDLANRLETVQEDLSNTNMELERSRDLAATLENDLTKIQSGATGNQSGASVAGTNISKYPASALKRGRFSPTSSIISGMDSSQSHTTTLDGLRSTEQSSGGSGIVPMITAQRDRFKKRISELEIELSSSYQTISTLRSEVASLQKDNLNLYERTRFISTYSQGSGTASASAYPLNSTPSSISISDGNTPLDKYRSIYESRISPFAAFRGRESAKAFKRMTLPERALFQVARFILSTRASRNLFALYCITLHICIFMMLFQTTPRNRDDVPGFSLRNSYSAGPPPTNHD